jgi:cation/acetate symporter
LGTIIIGVFYILTTFLGFGAATIIGRDFIAGNGGTNMSAPLLARSIGGDLFFAFISAIAFATIRLTTVLTPASRMI